MATFHPPGILETLLAHLPQRDHSSEFMTVGNSDTPWHPARTCGFRKCIRFRPMLILNLLGLLQNQNLGILPIYIVVQCFPHDNIV